MSDTGTKKIGAFIAGLKRSDLSSLDAFLHSSILSFLAIALLSVAAAFFATMSLQRIPTNLDDGMIASHNIKADRDYEIVDEEATQKFLDEATSGVLPVYDFDDRVALAIDKRIHDAFAAARSHLSDASMANGDSHLDTIFSEKLGVTPTPAQISLLKKERFNTHLETLIAGTVRRIMASPVVAERASLDAEKGRGVLIRRLKAKESPDESDQYTEAAENDVSRVASTEEARAHIARLSIPGASAKDNGLGNLVAGIAELLIEPNLSLNRTETEERRVEAASNVKSVIIKVKSGEMIVREGSHYEPSHIKILNGIAREQRRNIYSMSFAGTTLLIMLFIIIPFYLAEKFFRRVRASRSDHLFMAIVGLAILAIMRLSLLLAPAVHDAIFFNVTTASLNYMIPIAGGAMLLRMFLGAEITAIFAITISAVASFFPETDAQYIVFCLITNFAALIAIANADKRSLIIRAGLITGTVAALMMVAMRMASIGDSQTPATIADIVWCIFFAFMSGIGGSIFTMIAAPIVESISGYTSDIKLLELANLNHPLLRELIVRAPGTYHHSHMVGILGEAAAEAIGAKALLVRVGAYYHDIGKMKKPLYFVENTKGGENRHDRLSPHMSSLIVSAHVKEGLDMAHSARIPKIIADMIPEHHGTRMISFFYDKAKQQSDQSVQNIDEKDYSYPGPKPQTREAAILMLADVTEAAVRSLKEKSTTRIQQTVQRAITDIFTEKQLDECDITLKDLNEIARAFMRILLGIYHSRIEYPKDSGHEKNEASIVDESATSEDQAPQ